ncbi:pyridoxamine 5'-phosphate oxidase family protein [Cupriavidus sp. WKF15]|uniref:HugZ family pyridoxamine 5'-phosphate oxidase n=1 Tax=Cupriavidus sp. WKF15 TaxID=3032282 RepID=UPI0023E1987B|nr:pyridoxamine 5'-phosphate oxidase family protein [Cupriavidus sp. WKF15]WER50417.1 pyridoxamine 5'-phosphate oxidase family protein [Cupriavidus sp. WKF15]
MLIEHAINLLHEASYGTLATNSALLPGYPYATVVPYVPGEAHNPVICISALAEHTKNLLADSRISLSVLQPGVIDVQAARRLTIVGEAERFAPSSAVLSRYLRYEPGAEQLLALDFAPFRLKPTKIRFIAGVGRMGWVESSVLETMPQVQEQEELNLVREMSRIVPTGIRVLGVDCYGIDYEINGRRARQSFPNAPLACGALEKASLSIARSLA